MQAIYDSPWHNPALFYLAGGIFLVVLARRLPFLIGFLVLFTVEILADATVTGGWSPAAGTPALQPLAIAFVILGDYRYLVLVERYRRPGGGARPFWIALGFSLVVPIASQLVLRVLPRGDSRVTFLVYEVLFLLLSLVVLGTLRRRVTASPEIARWLRELSVFEVGQYALWALADVVILAGAPVGHLLRLVPNVLYYACFLPFVLARAPAEARS